MYISDTFISDSTHLCKTLRLPAGVLSYTCICTGLCVSTHLSCLFCHSDVFIVCVFSACCCLIALERCVAVLGPNPTRVWSEMWQWGRSGTRSLDSFSFVFFFLLMFICAILELDIRWLFFKTSSSCGKITWGTSSHLQQTHTSSFLSISLRYITLK